MPTKQDIYDLLDEVHRIVTDAQDSGWSDAPTQSALGSIKDYCNQIGALVHELAVDPTPAPPPDPPPAPMTILGYYGTYSGHGLAEDCYLGFTPEQASWGPHHGIDVLAPKPGRVEVYQFGTPLQLPLAADPEYAANHAALFDGWTCIAPSFPRSAGLIVGAQTMFVGVYIPDGGITLDDGSHAVSLGFGHIRGDVAVGRVDTGQRMFTSHDSGIRFENNGITARAAHIHLTIFRTGALSPNGDVDGRLALRALGWECQRLGSVPGPSDYMGGGWLAGRPKRDWTGHEIPPVPS